MNKETLEEAAKRLYPDNMVDLGFNNILNSSLIKRIDFIAGAKWQQNQEPNKYSEEELKEAFKSGFSLGCGSDVCSVNEQNRICKEWFDQFKDK